MVIESDISILVNYYISDLGRISAVILIAKIIDSLDDVVFGFLVDRLDIKSSRLFGRLAGEGRYLPWYRATFYMFPIFTVLFFLMPKSIPDGGKIAWFS